MPSPSHRSATDTVHLDDDSVRAIAKQIVEFQCAQGGERLIDAAEVARRLDVSRDYVYRHKDDFGVVRFGNGPKARLRFDPAKVTEALGRSSEPEPKPKRVPVRSVRRGHGVTLLPIRGESP
jgi:hypothetical protein